MNQVVKTKSVKLELSIEEIVSLYDEEALSKLNAIKALKAFDTDDFIEHLITDEEEEDVGVVEELHSIDPDDDEEEENVGVVSGEAEDPDDDEEEDEVDEIDEEDDDEDIEL